MYIVPDLSNHNDWYQSKVCVCRLTGLSYLSGRNGGFQIQDWKIQWPEFLVMENADGRLFVSKGSVEAIRRENYKTMNDQRGRLGDLG